MNATLSTGHRPGLLSQTLRYPRNQWYVAAAAADVGRKPLHRRLLGNDIVLFRTEAGEPVALSNWCPHRGFRFSDSKLIGDTIQCGYHGMRFGPSGECVHVPSQTSIPGKMAVAKFQLVERRSFIWIWLGEPDKCDAALMPAELEFEDPGHASGYVGTLEIAANAAVALENTIDITHASLLHPGILDSENWELMTTHDEVEVIQPTVIQTTKRFGKIQVKGYLAENMGVHEGGFVDRVRISREYLPALHTSIDVYYDVQDCSRVLARRIRYVGITPKDDRSCYLVAAYSSTHEYSAKALALALDTLKQDVIALESTQAAYEESGDRFLEYSVKADRSALMARRIIAKLAAAEGPMSDA
jgi:phenylpropionate dioxygenase-like ring-hydroxylating dioxygenase large terminal subunit